MINSTVSKDADFSPACVYTICISCRRLRSTTKVSYNEMEGNILNL